MRFPIGGEMSVALTLVFAWLVVSPVAFLLLVALHPRYLRWHAGRPRNRLISRVDLSTAVAPREPGRRPTWR